MLKHFLDAPETAARKDDGVAAGSGAQHIIHRGIRELHAGGGNGATAPGSGDNQQKHQRAAAYTNLSHRSLLQAFTNRMAAEFMQ
jgi:hypothetical protein